MAYRDIKHYHVSFPEWILSHTTIPGIMEQYIESKNFFIEDLAKSKLVKLRYFVGFAMSLMGF
jgi:hypothetical protein